MVECRTWTAEASGSSPDTLTKYLTCRGGVIAAQGSPKPLARERNLVPMPINEEVCRNGYCGVCKTFLCRFESDLPLQPHPLLLSLHGYTCRVLAPRGTPAGTDWVYPCRDNDHLAHLVEHRAFNLQVLGSNPRVITKECRLSSMVEHQFVELVTVVQFH